MSSTETSTLPARAFEAYLGELKRWRSSTSEALAGFRRWGIVNRLLDEQTSARLAYLERRLVSERLTIAFVAEFSRGKTELINALFFADLGTRLLPSGVGRTTLCPTEILWDPARPPSIRLLPIGTRESPKALREFIAEIDAWKEVPLDPTRPETVAEACKVIAESITVAGPAAVNLGLAAEPGDRVEIPRWRYAVINFPHPLLESGLTILDTPGHNTMGAEPELTVHRIPDAAAIVFMLGADTGVTRTDRELWSEHIETIHGIEQSCYVVLNKIDGLRDGFKPETQVLSEIERQVKASAEALHVAPARVFALSAKQGLVAKIQDDRDGLIQSRLYRLEQALAQGLVRERRLDHAAAVRAETRSAFAESRALIDSRLAFSREQLAELAALQGRNHKLVEVLARKAASERSRIEQARAMMMGMRTVHNRNVDALTKLLDPNVVRAAGVATRMAVQASSFSSGIGQSLDHFFKEGRERLRAAVGVIGEAHAMMSTVSRKFADEYQIATVEVPDFATDRFFIEIDRLEQRCARDFKGAGSLLTRRRSTLSSLFFDTVVLKVVHVFEIADREVRTWLNGFVRPLDARLSAFQEQSNSRIEGMGRIQNAETDLAERLEELKALAASVEAHLAEWEAHHQRLLATLDAEREPLAATG
ncbi:MAG: dynamin family protein [Pseudomonadota bacterium]|nr:dynamin family protein [Pseudomonadota bacterium]